MKSSLTNWDSYLAGTDFESPSYIWTISFYKSTKPNRPEMSFTSPILTLFKEASHFPPGLTPLKSSFPSVIWGWKSCSPVPPTPHLYALSDLQTYRLWLSSERSLGLLSLHCLGTNPIHWLAVSTPLPDFTAEKRISSLLTCLLTYLDLNAFYLRFLPVSHSFYFPFLPF